MGRGADLGADLLIAAPTAPIGPTDPTHQAPDTTAQEVHTCKKYLLITNCCLFVFIVLLLNIPTRSFSFLFLPRNTYLLFFMHIANLTHLVGEDMQYRKCEIIILNKI